MERCDVCSRLYFNIFDCLEEICTGTNYENTRLLYFLKMAYDMELIFEPCSNWSNCDSGLEHEMSIKIACTYLENENISQLKQALQFWKLSRAHDKIFSAASKTPPSEFKTVEIIRPNENICTIYLDFNIYQKYEENIDFQRLLSKCVQDTSLWFVYGSVHLDEVCRMNSESFESKRIESLQHITNNKEVLYYDDEILFCYEDIIEALKRAKKNMELNEGAENLKLVHSGDKQAFHIQYLKDSHKKQINNLHIVDLNEGELNEILKGVIACPYSIDELRNSDYKLNDRNFICTGIRSLYEMLDTLGFYSDKKERTIRSSVYDIEHLCYASKCKYFVTADKYLMQRAKEIYLIMGICTEVKSYEEFNTWLLNHN